MKLNLSKFPATVHEAEEEEKRVVVPSSPEGWNSYQVLSFSLSENCSFSRKLPFPPLLNIQKNGSLDKKRKGIRFVRDFNFFFFDDDVQNWLLHTREGERGKSFSISPILDAMATTARPGGMGVKEYE